VDPAVGSTVPCRFPDFASVACRFPDFASVGGPNKTRFRCPGAEESDETSGKRLESPGRRDQRLTPDVGTYTVVVVGSNCLAVDGVRRGVPAQRPRRPHLWRRHPAHVGRSPCAAAVVEDRPGRTVWYGRCRAPPTMSVANRVPMFGGRRSSPHSTWPAGPG